jgi:hypothetical protein
MHFASEIMQDALGPKTTSGGRAQFDTLLMGRRTYDAALARLGIDHACERLAVRRSAGESVGAV